MTENDLENPIETPSGENVTEGSSEENTVDVKESILQSIKKLVGVGSDNPDFDADILIHINSVFSILQQLGIGPDDGYFIVDDTATWTDYLGSYSVHVNMVKSYMAAKVRILFDPPVSSAVADSLNRICSEFEWRANVAAENHDLHKEANGDESGSDDP